MAGPTFCIVMPAYNAARTIAASIRSVLCQTRPDFELIVVDDGSSDATVAVASDFTGDPRVRIVQQENQGPGAARNRGIAEGTGPYISLIDSDDLWLPTYLESMGAALDAEPSAGLAYTDAWVLEDRTGRIRKTTAMRYQNPPLPPPDDPIEFLRLLVGGNFVFTSSTVRRSTLDEIGPFDVLLKPSEDYELWLRIVASGYRAVRVPENLAVYRKHGGSLSTDTFALMQGEREAVRLVAEQYDVPEEIRRVARRRLRKLDLLIVGLGDDRGLTASLQRVRVRAVSVKEFFAQPFVWHRRPPVEVSAVLAAAQADRHDARASNSAGVADDGPERDDTRSRT